MAEIELRAVVCTRRLSDEKSINSEKHLQLKLAKLKDNASKRVTKTKTMDSVVYLAEQCVFVHEGSTKESRIAEHVPEEFDEGVRSNNSSEGSEPSSEGDRKKRCCDRYDSSESSDSGVVVLSSTDCSSSSSACSGHSDITSDPGSPYSSPTSAALCSPEEFPGSHSEESEDSPPSPSTVDELATLSDEPRPPDPMCWPSFSTEDKPSRLTKKRPYPFCSTPTSTPKRFRTNSGNMGTTITVNLNNNTSLETTTNSNTTSLIPYQPVNLNSTHQKPSFQKLDSKINNNLEPSSKPQQPPQTQQQQKWPLPKGNLGTEVIKGQGKITEYFKTQIKSTLPTQKLSLSSITKNKGQAATTQVKSSVKKDGIDKFLRIYSGTSPSTAKEMCVQPVLVLEEAQRDSKILSLLSEAETKREQTKQPVAESKHQEDALSRDSKEDVETIITEPEKSRIHRRLSLDTTLSRPRNGETELFSDKLGLLTTSVDTSKVLSDKVVCVVNRVSVAIDEVTTDKVTPTTLSRDSVTVVETITRSDEKKTIRVIEVVESRSCEDVASSPVAENKTEIATPLSPILSVPRVIRFPVPQRIQTGGVEGTVESVRCCWSQCELKFRCTSKLLEHLQSIHVNTQMRSEQFVCLWVGCKVHARPSCSLTWLERHVLSHGGSKPFRCIVDGCGQRFSSQSSLERHVNSHFNAPTGVNGSGSASSTARRSTDTAPNKLFRRNGKKLRYRRQPWSARMFDYIDTGMMEGVQHRLLNFTGQQLRNVTTEMQEQQISQGNHLALRSKVLARRVETDGTTKFLVRWVPEDIIPDEWLLESEVKPSQLVPLSRLSSSASTHLHHSLLPPNSKSTRKPRKPRVPAATAAAGVTTRARSLS